MLKINMPVDFCSITRLMAVLSVISLFLVSSESMAGRDAKRGVAIPDAVAGFSGATRFEKNDSGGYLLLPVGEAKAWDLLNRVLENLNIKAQERDESSRQLLTEWILWVWNPAHETGGSKPPLKALSRTYERHRFQFSIFRNPDGKRAEIHISDRQRQKEVDITPDSEYTWYQWQDASLQSEAAWSFLRRLQGDFEAALTSHVLPSTAVAPRIVEPVPAAIPNSGQSKRESEQTVVTSTVMVESVPSSPASQAKGPPAPSAIITPGSVPISRGSDDQISETGSRPVRTQAATKAADQPVTATPVPTKPEPADNAITQPAIPQATPAKSQQTSDRTAAQTASTGVDDIKQKANNIQEKQDSNQVRSEAVKNSAERAPAVPQEDSKAQPPTPLAVQGGLLVQGGLAASWQALAQAIDELGVKVEHSDQAQHMLITQWVEARYDKKNQQLTLESKNNERWAFDLWGKGRQRHRFQLIMLPVDGGAKTMVYAYHTGFQIETDQTPDSSQTMLYWKDHNTEPAVAMAFLRRLRLVVR